MTPKNDIPWKSLGACQLILFLLTFLAFLDMKTRLEITKLECGCLSEELERDKRSLKG